MTKTVLSVNKLVKKYGNKTVVDHISFTVHEGEIFALVGQNGAGKSTTLRMVATILSPTEGTITVTSLDSKTHARDIRERISYLPEEAGAYKSLTGYEYLKFMAALYAHNTKEEKEFLATGVGITELGDRIKSKIGTYSKGMTRKLLLARTLMSSPQLAILDEPTSGLDVANSLEIRDGIRSRAKNTGMAVLLSSHNMLEIEYLADAVGIIHNGSIKIVGSPAELKERYRVHNLEEVFMKVAV